jgi:hypothetical protein
MAPVTPNQARRKITLSKTLGLLPLLSALALVPVGCAQETSSKGKECAAALSTSYTWYDTDGQHTVWLNPALVAEFGAPPHSESAVKRAHPAAVAEPGSRGLARIWRLDGDGVEHVLRQARAVNPAGKYSPVFSDGPADGARKRALPGGVIVYFKPDWTESQISAWTASQGLSIARKLEIGPNIYVLETAPGFAALETANRIHQSGGVVSAQPNWWVQVTTR